MKKLSFIIFFSAMLMPLAAGEPKLTTAFHLNLRGEPLYQKGWTHFKWVNPDAPKGGRISRAVAGTAYDNFHRYALRGAVTEASLFFYDSLMASSPDEIDVLYPLIAEKVEYPRDNAYFIFHINPDAKDQEGQPLDAEDAAFSFQILFEKGVPQFRAYYAGVTVEALDKRRVRFSLPQKLDDQGQPLFDGQHNKVYDKDTILSLAQIPVFPRRFWQNRDFSEPLMTPPVGTGPYRVKEYQMGQSVTLERVKDYWAQNLPVCKGQYNFDIIHYDYYRDVNVAFEAFKAGEYDIRAENSAKNWATEYNGKWVQSSSVRREEIPSKIAQRTNGFIFNTERSFFADRRVRLALNYFFDFEWINKNLFYNAYERTYSFFQHTPYEAGGLPSAEEAALLRPLRALIPAEVWTAVYRPPVTDGTGHIRPQAREALRLLDEAGWTLRDGKLRHKKTGEVFRFELLITSVDTERIAIAFQRNLARFGIDMRIRMVDSSQFINRIRKRDFDMTSSYYLPNQIPSSSLMISWHSKYLDSTWNAAGVQDAAVDFLTEAIANAQEDDAKLLTLGRALDRVLTWNAYLIPFWQLAGNRIAWRDRFDMPAQRPVFDEGLEVCIVSWWAKDRLDSVAVKGKQR